jgi:Protein of unknown function (DUF3102)
MRDESSYNAFITGPAADSQKTQESTRRLCERQANSGRRLTEAKPLAGNGGWLPWLEHEFGWTEMTATRFGQKAR